MTKKKKDIKGEVLQESLRLFNNRGIEYVGMREIASNLSLKLGNITYYFPRKADLIYAHWQNLVEANSKLIAQSKIDTLVGFLVFLKSYFKNQYEHRCIILSFHHIIRHDERLWLKFKAIAQKRKMVFPEILEKFIRNGTINKLNKDEVQVLNESVIMITRYWLLQERIKDENFDLASTSEHYSKLIFGLLYPYLTEKTKQEFNSITL